MPKFNLRIDFDIRFIGTVVLEMGRRKLVIGVHDKGASGQSRLNTQDSIEHQALDCLEDCSTNASDEVSDEMVSEES